MKRIIISIGLLLVAIVTMAYLYFSKLNKDQHSTDVGLHAAAISSGIIFSFENDKGITDILKEQHLFEEILGTNKYAQFTRLKTAILSLPRINQALDKQNIYISFVPGNNQEIDFLCSTQINGTEYTSQIPVALKAGGIKLETLRDLTKLTLADSSVYYMSIKKDLVLLSNSEHQITAALTKDLNNKPDEFIEYILASKRFTKNSLAQLYINFNQISPLLKNIISGNLNGELAFVNKQDSFAALTYNYSNDKILLTGTTIANDPNNYYNLFSELPALKISISNLLPSNTSSYTIYAVENYTNWRKSLEKWFSAKKESQTVAGTITNITSKYHLNVDDTFPKYFKDQLVTFQLNTSEKLGAISLSNGDKLTQLLLDLSDNYNDEIKVFKEPGLLYAYFGQPFVDFKKPYYTIIDNYMIFANNPSTLVSFMNSYTNNKLLINTPNYISANNQLPGNSSIIFYVDHENSTDIFEKNINSKYFRHLQSAEGLKKYNSFIYQLSGDNGKFQTNILINKSADVLQKDSLAL